METVRDISSLFSDREIHYQVYRWVALLVVGVSAALIFAFAYWLTTPIRALGRVATQLAQGDYTPRAQVSGPDGGRCAGQSGGCSPRSARRCC